MLVLVNTMNRGLPLGNATLAAIRALGANGVRTDIWPEGAEEQLREFSDNPDLQLLALIHGGPMLGTEKTLAAEAEHAAIIAKDNLRMLELPKPPMFELGNEAECKGGHWEDADYFGRAVAQGARKIWAVCGRETMVISGGIHNPNKKTQKWLAKAARHFPTGEGNFAIGFHDYAPGMGNPDVPQSGFSSVDEQIRSLKKLGRPLFDTESGGHTGPKEKHTDDQVAAWLTRRLDLSIEWGLLGSVVYQLNDGPALTDHESRFGLLRADGSWKPSAHALKKWQRSRAAVPGS